MADTLVQISPFFGHGIEKGSGKVIRIDGFVGGFNVTCNDDVIGHIGIHQTPVGFKAITINDTLKLFMYEGCESECGVGAGIWMSSLVLSCWVKANGHVFNNKRVLELGSGVGLCGLVVASLQSSARYLKLSDRTNSLCQLLNKNIEQNAKQCKIIPNVQKYNWYNALSNDYLPYDHLQGVYDVIIAADCLYHNTKDVLKEAVLKNLAEGGVFVMANPPETSRAGIDDFIYALKEHGDVSIEPHTITMKQGGYSKEVYIVVLQKC